ILDLPAAQRQHLRCHSFVPFVAAVPTVVFVHAILVIVTIRPVALVVVRDEIVQGETIVGGYVVHALVGVVSIGAAVGKEVVAAINATHQLWDHSRIAFNETANVIAEASVPLQPSYAGKSATELIGAGI